MITIFTDFQQIYTSSLEHEIVVVSQPKDYIVLRQRIRRALSYKENLKVYIQSKMIAHWLDDLRDYDPSLLNWQDLNLRNLFEQKYQTKLPSEIEDIAIKELNLLDLPNTFDSSNVIGWILHSKLDYIWRPTIPYSGHLSELAVWAIQARTIPQGLLPLIEARLQQWTLEDSRYSYWQFVPREDSWQNAGKNLIARWVFRLYPSNFQLTHEWYQIPLEDCSRHQHLFEFIINFFKEQINKFWRSILSDVLPEDIFKYLGCMTGISQEEFSAFHFWAENHLNHLSLSLIDLAKKTFSNLDDAITELDRLRAFIPPNTPVSPSKDWEVKDWLKWATEEYLPYFAWVIRNNQPRELQVSLGNLFSDWYIENYPLLIPNTDSPLLTSQFNRVQTLLLQNDVVIWFVVDGLSWWQGQRLAELCANNKLGVKDIQPLLSALPSVTSISKRALALGFLDKSSTDKTIYQLFSNRYVENNRPCSVFTQITELDQAISTSVQPGLYILLYNDIDHQAHNSTSFTNDYSFEGHFNQLANSLRNIFKNCQNVGLTVAGVIGSDHGSTILPEKYPVLPEPSNVILMDVDEFSENTQADTPSNIYASNRACVVNLLPSDMKGFDKDWYFLHKDLYNLPHHCLIPRNYSSFGRRKKGWTHGGATPEETVISHLEILPKPLDVLEPSIEFQGILEPHKSTVLKITISNLNHFPLKSIHLSFYKPNPSLLVPILAPKSKESLELNFPSATSKELTQDLHWLLSYEVGGISKRITGIATLPVKRFQVNELDKFFEDL